jgi:hypothetical protein
LEKSDFFVHLVDFSPVVFGRVVFWSSCRLVELSFGRVGFGGHVGGRLVGGRVDGLPENIDIESFIVEKKVVILYTCSTLIYLGFVVCDTQLGQTI